MQISQIFVNECRKGKRSMNRMLCRDFSGYWCILIFKFYWTYQFISLKQIWSIPNPYPCVNDVTGQSYCKIFNILSPNNLVSAASYSGIFPFGSSVVPWLFWGKLRGYFAVILSPTYHTLNTCVWIMSIRDTIGDVKWKKSYKISRPHQLILKMFVLEMI